MADGRHVENRHFVEIWHTTADFENGVSHGTKNENFKNSRCRTAATMKIVLLSCMNQQPIVQFQ